MKINNKIKIGIASGLCLILIVSIIACVGKNSAGDKRMAESRVTAGASDVLGTEAMLAADVTAGVSDVLVASNSVVVEDTGINPVGIGFQEDGTFCGYTNLGLAVVDGNLNVREAPSTDGHIVGKITNHAAMEVIGVEGDWIQMTSGNVEGYVSAQYVVTGDEAIKIAQQEVRLVASVTTDGLRVRKEPSTDSSIIEVVGKGEDLVVVEDLGEWVKVEIDDLECYVFAEYVEVGLKLKTAMTLTELHFGEGVSDGRVALCQFALQYVGNPYVWGGTSLTKGADCSGFVLSVFKNFGYSLPRTSAAQSKTGTKVSTSELKPGDLVFYTSNSSGGGVGHVAIYIGNGQIVHASSPRDGIKISNMWYRSPLGCRRIIND